MKTLKLFIALVFIILLTTKCDSGENKMEAIEAKSHRDTTQLLLMDEIHRRKLREIQYYFIKTAVPGFYNNRDEQPLREYLRVRGYSFAVMPAIDQYHEHEGRTIHTWTRLIIQSVYMENEIRCIEQIEHNGKIYEYWFMHEYSKKRPYSYRNCEFLVTEANSQKDERTIIHKSDQFFSTYQVTPECTIKYPIENIFKLDVGSYPECFENSELEEIKKILQKVKSQNK